MGGQGVPGHAVTVRYIGTMRSLQGIDPTALLSYVQAHTEPADRVQSDLIERTRALGGPAGMQIGQDQAMLLTMLVASLGVTRAVEVGTFTGYSSLAIARGLAPGGRLLCCDISEEWTAIARDAWAAAGVEDRIELRIAPALETLRALPVDEPIDFAFIDADKETYAEYFAEILPRVRPGGIIAVDNVLWSGRVLDPQDETTRIIDEFNTRLAADDRVDVVMLTIGDGLTLARKR